jgi:GWxTD domain-containing protein
MWFLGLEISCLRQRTPLHFAGTVLSLALFAGLITGNVSAQEKNAKPDTGAARDAQRQQDQDPLKRPVDPKTRQEQSKALKTELSKTYKRWLDEDVRWIITDEERAAFRQLSNDEERDQFIEQFWQRRNPTPDAVENPYKEEHYRRIAYANEHFAAGIAGWKTDRGRIYIMYGPPDQIEPHPSGGYYQRPLEEGGGSTTTFPFETWRYRYLPGRDLGNEVIIEFVDSCMCGDYRMTMDPNEKNALLHTPGGGITQAQQMGVPGGPSTNNNKQFDRLARFAALNRPPEIKFKDLEEKVTHRITVNLLPFDVRTDFVKVTSDTVLVPVTIQVKNRDVTFVNKDGVQRGTINIFGRVSTLSGRVAQTFEDTVQIDVPAELLPRTLANESVYWKALPLRPGRYRLDLVLKDVNGDRAGTWGKGVIVPEYSEDKLASSSLILADQMEKVAAKNVGAGSFVIGTTKVRPRVEPADGRPATFKRSQRVNFWMQVYNLGIDKETHRPDATIQYQVVNAATKRTVVDTTESTMQLGNVGEQVTLEKSLPLSSLEPGIYNVTIRVDDKVSKQSISPTARFAVEDDGSSRPVQSSAGSR